MNRALDSSAAAVLDFWFGPPAAAGKPRPAWFTKNPDFDAKIVRSFGADYEHARSGALDHWTSTPLGALALTLILDQFPRNMFRDDARAFATDARAPTVAREAVAAGFDQPLHWTQRTFLYLPFEHSENPAMQEQCLNLMSTLPDADHKDGGYSYALRHWRIIKRFGRFPHRNAVLGRVSTAEERAFLQEPGSSF